jgi:hypothetical protein
MEFQNSFEILVQNFIKQQNIKNNDYQSIKRR